MQAKVADPVLEKQVKSINNQKVILNAALDGCMNRQANILMQQQQDALTRQTEMIASMSKMGGSNSSAGGGYSQIDSQISSQTEILARQAKLIREIMAKSAGAGDTNSSAQQTGHM